MGNHFFISFLVLACICVPIARAEPPIVQLPDDGWWISYRSSVKQRFDGQTQEHSCKYTCSLVGTVTDDDQKLRWVEVNSEYFIGDKKYADVLKFLVSEKALLESDQPLDNLKRVWKKNSDGNVRETSVWHGIYPDNAKLMIFPGLWQHGEREKKERIIEYQQRKLTIAEARTREITMNARTVNRPRVGKIEAKSVVEATAWFDPATSPVLAAAKIETRKYQNDELRLTTEEELVVEDSGIGAHSQLPDNN